MSITKFPKPILLIIFLVITPILNIQLNSQVNQVSQFKSLEEYYRIVKDCYSFYFQKVFMLQMRIFIIYIFPFVCVLLLFVLFGIIPTYSKLKRKEMRNFSKDEIEKLIKFSL